MEVPKDPDNRQCFYLRKAAQLAFRSNLTQRHGCVIVNSLTDEIISTGYNHTYIHMCHRLSCHAEYDALRKVKKDVNMANVEMYVVRIGPESLGNPLKLSRPCGYCTKMIQKANIGRVFYSWGVG